MALPAVGGGYQNTDGNLNEAVIGKSGTPSIATATATLTTAQAAGLLVANPSTSAATYTTPTGTQLDAAFSNAKVGSTVQWNIVNLGTSSGALTITGGTGITTVGSATVAVTSSAQYLWRKTDVGLWSLYRIA